MARSSRPRRRTAQPRSGSTTAVDATRELEKLRGELDARARRAAPAPRRSRAARRTGSQRGPRDRDPRRIAAHRPRVAAGAASRGSTRSSTQSRAAAPISRRRSPPASRAKCSCARFSRTALAGRVASSRSSRRARRAMESVDASLRELEERRGRRGSAGRRGARAAGVDQVLGAGAARPPRDAARAVCGDAFRSRGRRGRSDRGSNRRERGSSGCWRRARRSSGWARSTWRRSTSSGSSPSARSISIASTRISPMR